MRALEGTRRLRNGLLGVLITLCVVGAGQSLTSTPILFAEPIYYAEFHDSAGIEVGDTVRITGIDVGHVHSLELQGDGILMGFTLGDRTIGSDSRLAIRTETLLGARVVEITPRGSRQIQAGHRLPLDQSMSTYQIFDAFSDITNSASDWNVDAVKRSLDVLSETLDRTSPHLSAALDGVARFSATIGERDEQVKSLLTKLRTVAGVIGDRRDEINQLLLDTNTVLAALNQRSQSVDLMLSRIAAVSREVRGLIDDNPTLTSVTRQLASLTDMLALRRDDLANLLTTVANFSAALSEAVGSGPYFNAMIVNLLPGQLLQPFIDAAFKHRGIDPREFWRNAGLPAFRFPDPNGAQLPNAAPPPAPTVFEGTPEHPGPAVAPGSPCSYTPGPGGLPTPHDPLPCARADEGPFGAVPGQYPPPDVAVSAPDPHGPRDAAGHPAAALPGHPPPSVPGTAAPLPPAPPGARTADGQHEPGPHTDIPAINAPGG